MEGKFKILVGSAHKVEAELNDLRSMYIVTITGFSATNELTTVLVDLWKKATP